MDTHGDAAGLGRLDGFAVESPEAALVQSNDAIDDHPPRNGETVPTSDLRWRWMVL